MNFEKIIRGRECASDQRQSSGHKRVRPGHDAGKLEAFSNPRGGLETRVALITDAPSLHPALAGAAAVINAAGPFTYTAAPVMEAALRMRTPYIDVVAEPGIAAAAFDNYQGRARDAGIVIAPAAAFYRGLGSLARGYADGNAMPTSALVAATREIAHAASAGCR